MFAFHNPVEPFCAIGLMSGTSADAIDGCAATFQLENGRLIWRLLATATRPFEAGLRVRLLAAMSGESLPASEFCALNAQLGEAFAQTALDVMTAGDLKTSDVHVIGSHGQTVSHLPPGADVMAATLQLGNPAIIAERTGVSVIADFRSRDMALGGQGAPLVPLADRWLFQQPAVGRAMQNIGGVGNLTILPPLHAGCAIRAFDTGPGNLWIDAAMRRFYDAPMDRDGRVAASASPDLALLRALHAHPGVHDFLNAPPPKSTGRELFSDQTLQAVLDGASPSLSPPVIIASLTAFTAQTILDALARWTTPADDLQTLIVGGGGAKNPTLMGLLADGLAKRPRPLALQTHADYGLPDAYKEAFAFALLAWASACGAAGNLPDCTGARHGAVLGAVTWGGPPVRVLE